MKKIVVATLVALTGLLWGCTDEFLTTPPKGQADVEILKNKAGIEKLLIGAYAVVDGVNGRNGEGWAGADLNWVWGGVASDDAYKGTVFGDQNPINDIEGFYVNADNQYVANHWKPMYDGILRVNDILRILPEVEDMSPTEKTHVEAQAKFLRAHWYVELTRVHGPVPYIDETTENPGAVPNDHLVYPEIEADLQFAADNLPPSWSDKGRATSWAAKTYKAYVHMLQNEHALAMPLLNEIYDGPFELIPSFEQNYLIAHNNNPESIFEVQYAVNDGFNTANAGRGNSIIGMTFMGGSGFFQPSHSLVSAFRVDENGLPLLYDEYDVDDMLEFDRVQTGAQVLHIGPVDPRLDHTVGRPGVPFLDWGVQEGLAWIRDPNNGGPYITKKQMFKQSEKGTYSSTTGRTFPNANNYRKFKLGQVILWLAECEVEIGSLERARSLVNEIRQRAMNSNVVTFEDGTPAANYDIGLYEESWGALGQDYARRAVRYETRLEYAMEGYRFFDLVRWGIAADVMNRYLQVDATELAYLQGRTFVAGQHEIWPIPQIQIDVSLDENGQPVLIQNPGY